MRASLVAAVMLCPVLPAGANDSAAEQAAGGLVLVENGSVSLQREDLRIGPERIDVEYAFRNTSAEAETLTVAFPLPTLDGELAMTPLNLPFPADRNYVHFTVEVDGRMIQPELEERAFLGKDDVSDVLRRYKLDLNPLHEGVFEAIEALPPQTRGAVVKAGLAFDEAWDPQWRYEARFHFPVTFPAGKTVTVKHSYAPVRGSLLVSSDLLTDTEFAERFCVDPATKKGMQRLIAEAAKAQNAQNADDPASPPVAPQDGTALAVTIPYILTTANNWAGPIAAFNLTVNKGAPGNVLSLCQEGIRKTGPTSFGFSAKNYVPEQDLLILIVSASAEALGIR